MSSFVNSFKGILGVNLTLSGNEAKIHFHKLKDLYYSDSLLALGENVEWMEAPDAKESKIRLSLKADFEDRKDWNHQHGWLKEQLEKFHQFFAPKIKEL